MPDTSVAEPHVRFTEAAHAKLTEIMAAHPNPVAGLRLQIVGRQGGQFHHLLSLVEEGAQAEGDLKVDADGIAVFTDVRSAPYVDRIEIHYFEDADQRGLEFHNPNALWSDPREYQIQDLFDRYINPQIGSHGGRIELVGVVGRTAYVEFVGGCVGCGMINVTLRQGVEVAVKEHVSDIDEIVDATDHNSGTNPYYRPQPHGHAHAHSH
jgi:Fe/S biogenesis protein NfuA